jgi:hypothetical protein
VTDARTGSDPTDDTGGARLGSLDAATRVDAFIGSFRISVDGLHRRATLEKGGVVLEGNASGVGAELGWRATEDIELFVGHLQGILVEGEGPGAIDPTLTSVGGRVAISDDARVEGRIGVPPDLTPVAAVNASVDDDNGISRYATMLVTTDAPWVERGATSVSGARQTLGPDAIVYAEDRISSERSARAMGADVMRGPFFVGVSLESGQRVVDEAGTLRFALSSHGGFRLRRLTLQTFGEVIGYRLQRRSVRARGTTDCIGRCAAAQSRRRHFVRCARAHRAWCARRWKRRAALRRSVRWWRMASVDGARHVSALLAARRSARRRSSRAIAPRPRLRRIRPVAAHTGARVGSRRTA